MARMRFGTFMGPFHAHRGQNPTLALHRDLELVQHLDTLGYDEAWFGEHHSGATELIASPEIFCAHAAGLTKRIKLGTGVISLPYHNPLWVADRAILLDHLLRGRFMLGIGPGVLPSDASMIGVDPTSLREALAEDLPVLMRLLGSDGLVSVKTDRYELVDARCQLDPYSDFDVAVASMFSTSGPLLAGAHGLGLLQLSGLTPQGMAILSRNWQVAEEAAARAGTKVDRSQLRVVGIMHLAESREQAIEDVRFGLDEYFDYTQDVIGVMGPEAGRSFDERLAWAMDTGFALLGTPADAVAKLEELVEASDGGIGAFLFWSQEWASYEATRRSYELFARHVMPVFQGTTRRLDLARDWLGANNTRLQDQARVGAARWQEKAGS